MIILSGKVAVITGASRGVGQRIAIRLAQHGAKVALIARSEAALQTLAQSINESGGSAYSITADLGALTGQGVEAIRATVEEKLGVASILVNAAGIFGPFQRIAEGNPQAWIEAMQVNAIAPYLFIQSFTPGMIANGWGRIINVTSAASLHTPGPFNSAYATSKVALNQLTRHLASELAETGVTANVIHPGDVKTEMWADIREQSKHIGAAGENYTNWVKWVEESGGDDPEKPADLVLDLMKDEASAINGTFQWIKDGLQAPIPSWDNQTVPKQPWRD
jgi:NAD(P)-dependent dehydrogenase (short-subunit alcohol dehydrogenase family)